MKKAIFAGALFLLVQNDGLSQEWKVQRVPDQEPLSPPFTLSGKARERLQWTDEQGKHLLILSEHVKKSTGDSHAKDAELTAMHFLEIGGQWVRQWKVTDFERDCPTDVGATFIPESVAITDLNKDRLTEISFMYRTYCAGGVDPHSLKFIMYSGQHKYVIRGETLVAFPNQPTYGGRTVIDVSFKSAPREFQQFALAQWQKYRPHPRD